MASFEKVLQPKVAIIGGGPAGLNLAAKLAPRVDGAVMVFDREKDAGGIPRHANHIGYGIRDRQRVYLGPKYAQILVAEAKAAGAIIYTRTQITNWVDDDALAATSPDGRLKIQPEVFVFATGARERPRPARHITGDRSAGILTTGQLQNLVHLHGQKVGKNALIVGGELVSWSAALTLKRSGTEVAGLVTEYPKAESYGLFNIGGRMLFQTKVITNSRVVALHGKPRIEQAELENVVTGERILVPCDTVVFTGDWIPDNELLRMRGVELDPTSLSPVVDGSMRTNIPGIFTVGNVNHPVETADVVSLEGQFVADQIISYLHGKRPADPGVRIRVTDPFRWVSPAVLRPDDPAPARERLVAGTNKFIAFPTVVLRQDGKEIGRMKLMWPASPGRAFRIPASLLAGVDYAGGDLELSVE
ncbi:MAG: FAD-dependent oxidoreductase [Trueperella sp.]|nr:FAD-dependent oxidoreductase [Trueperella sp.]